MNKLPNLYEFLWNGRPLSSTVIKESGFTTWPGYVVALNLVPSRKSTTKSTPVKASSNVISFSIRRSAPFLLKSGCGYSFTTIITSPASLSGCSSDSPWNTYFSPCGAPLSTFASRTFFSLNTFLPLQSGHLLASSIYSPVPPQSSHGPVDCEYIPGPSIVILVTIPRPLHFEHVEFAPSLPPFPPHVLQILSLFTAIFVVFPLNISSRVTLMECWTDLPFYGPLY